MPLNLWYVVYKCVMHPVGLSLTYRPSERTYQHHLGVNQRGSEMNEDYVHHIFCMKVQKMVT